MIFFGVDGGSTKTDALLADDTGRVLFHKIYGSCNYPALGGAGIDRHISGIVGEMLRETGLAPGDLTCSAFGMPAYGEIEETETTIPAMIHRLLPAERVKIVNDAVLGWSGSLSGKPGVNIVSGTGSIGYGIDPHGNQARAGGWSTLLSDEGSCSWIGIRTMNMFFKQSDGRLPRTPLYDIFKARYRLDKKDIYFLNNFITTFAKDRSQYAKIQMVAYEAHLAGDPTIAPLYGRAAWELSELARAIIGKLDFDANRPVDVSYSGGLFKVGKLILQPLEKHLSALNTRLMTPVYGPNIGAVAYAARDLLAPEALEAMLKRTASEIA